MDSINNACKLGSDAWLELQAFKTRQLNRREKLNRHKILHKDLINGTNLNQASHSPANASSSSTNNQSSNFTTNKQTNTNQQPNASLNHAKLNESSLASIEDGCQSVDDAKQPVSSAPSSPTRQRKSIQQDAQTGSANSCTSSNRLQSSNSTNCQKTLPSDSDQRNQINLELIECLLLLKLCDVALKLPIDSRSLQRSICRIKSLENTSQALIENLLQKFAHQELITIEDPTAVLLSGRRKNLTDEDDEYCIYVTSADHTKLVEFDKSFGSLQNIRALLSESKCDESELDECDHHPGTKTSLSPPIQGIRNQIAINLGSIGERGTESSGSFSRTNRDKMLDAKLALNNSNSASEGRSKRLVEGNERQKASEDIERLLSLTSTRERESKKLGEELLELLSKPTAKERNLLESFRSTDGYQVQEFCPKGTKGECVRNNKGAGVCNKLHFKKIIAKHTEESLGDCSFLNTCFHMDSCKYVHYEVDYGSKSTEQQKQRGHFKRPYPAEPKGSQSQQPNHDSKSPAHPDQQARLLGQTLSNDTNNNNRGNSNNNSITGGGTHTKKVTAAISNQIVNTATASNKFMPTPEEQARIEANYQKRFKTVLYPPQWIQCDLRFFDMSLLGKFSVVMADPPWDIHMELPYGTMSDDEMRKLNIPALQDEGVIFLWVTGRAMELGRECLSLWGYERCDEIIWVKTNQLQRIIRTGRTGHWLNHGKEHCLVGVKGNPKGVNRGLDCDVIVAEVRATSHKPDEIYGIIERLSPGTRKIELFGRAHNVQPNWITLGNQLNGVRLIEPNLVNAFKKLNLPFQTADPH